MSVRRTSGPALPACICQHSHVDDFQCAPKGDGSRRRGLVYLSCSTYYGVVVVIAKAGAEAALLLGHEDQTSVFADSDDTDGTNIDTIQMADRTTILLRRGTTRTNTWYTHNSIFSHSWR